MNFKQETKKPRIDPAVKALLSMYWQFKRLTISMDLLRGFSSFCGAFIPLYIAKIANSKGDVDYIFFVIWLLLGTILVHSLFWALADFGYAKRVRPMLYKLREIMFRTTWDNDYVSFVAKPSGKTAATITRIQSQVDAMYIAYNWNFITLLAAVPVLAGLMASVIIENSIAYLCFLVVIFIALKLQLKAIRYAQGRFADVNTSADGNIFDSFANFVNVVSFGARKKETQLFNQAHDELIEKDVRAGSLGMWFWASASFLLRGVLWPIILFFNLYLLKNNEISFSQFILSVTVLMEFSGLFWRMVDAFHAFNENFANYKTNYHYLFNGENIVKDFYSKPKEELGVEFQFVEAVKPKFEKAISFNNLNFAYPDRPGKLTLKNINLEIKKGEKIGVVGKSGSGKSTLVKLLLGFYDFDGETLKVDDKPLTKEELSTLNCYVPQDTTLFQQSISFNIAYAKNGEVTQEEVVAAAKKAHAHEFILTLKDGYDTLVGERGIKLSLGQRQRIALARAFLKDSQLLILDEATSSLDSKTESLVQESLEELWRNRTVIAVAHRLSTLNNVDRIIVIDNAQIVEQGTKTELLAMNGIFTELWNHQANGMIIEDDEDEVNDNED